MERLIKKNGNEKFTQIVAPGAMRFLDFSRLQLEKGERYALETGSREAALNIFGGKVSVTVEHPGGKTVYQGAGDRADVFSGAPVVIYVPPKSRYEVIADTKADVGIFTAASRATIGPALLQGKDVSAKTVGRDNWTRTVYSSLGDNLAADSLLVGETLNPPGNWSSYPPHKHDKSNPPNEAVLEEIYFFRVKPAQGYGFIWTYTAPGDPQPFSNVFVVEDGDTVLLPKGYHPTVAAPGYQLHYTWALAGEERRYGAWADDPRHAWVKN